MSDREKDTRERVAECGCSRVRFCEAFGCESVKPLLEEIDRLRRGDFTEDEFQNLCHRFSEADACRFAKGCVEYNRNLFGEKSHAAFFAGRYEAPIHSLPEEG